MALCAGVAVCLVVSVPGAMAASTPTTTLTISEVDGKKVSDGKLPAIVISPTVVWVTGQAKVGTTVTVKKETATTTRCTAKADRTGRWSCALPTSAFGLSTDRWNTTALVASATIDKRAVTAKVSVTAKLPTAPPVPSPGLTVTQVEGKPVANGKAPSFIADKAVIWVTGKTTVGAKVSVAKKTDAAQACTSTADKDGRWSCSLPTSAFNPTADAWTTTVLVASTTLGGAATSVEVSVTIKAPAPVPAPDPVLKVLTYNGNPVIDGMVQGTQFIGHYGSATTMTGTAKPGQEVKFNYNCVSETPVIADSAGNWSAQLSCSYRGLQQTPRVILFFLYTDDNGRFVQFNLRINAANIPNPPPVFNLIGGAIVPTVEVEYDLYPSIVSGQGLNFEGFGLPGSQVTAYLKSDPAVSCTATVVPAKGQDGWECAIPEANLPLEAGQGVSTVWGVTAVDPAGAVLHGLDTTVILQSDTDPARPTVTSVNGEKRVDDFDWNGFKLFGYEGKVVEFVGTAPPGATVTLRPQYWSGRGERDVLCTAIADSDGVWACDATLPTIAGNSFYRPFVGTLMGQGATVYTNPEQ